MGMFGTNPSEGVLVASDNRAKREQLRVYQARQVLQASKKSRLRKDQWLSIGGALVAVTLASLAVFGYVTLGPGAPAKAPDIAISENREWTGEIMFGDIEVGIVLDGINAPQATANFVDLATKGFYDGVSCHSLSVDVVFVMQCGDPTGTGTGGPGYRFEDEAHPELTFDKPYLLAMANAGPGTNGSQFFITVAATTWLNFKHTIFGEVADQAGRDVVDTIAAVETGSGDRPKSDVVIQSIEIVRS
jgi:peptidyl-prolyl cis-trans isomerase A (cyclophilin A)